MSAVLEPVVTALEATKSSKTEYEPVAMKDGRTVQFPGKRQMDKTPITDVAAETAGVRFDFRNGQTISISSADLDIPTILQALAHGLSQKCGDTVAGVAKVDDMFLGVEEMIERLKKGEWAVAREAGDSFSGASIVIRALCEVTGKSLEEIKAFLTGKLEAAKAAGAKLTRNDLYSSFRAPNSKTGVVIERMEREERAKAAKLDVNDLLAEIGGA